MILEHIRILLRDFLHQSTPLFLDNSKFLSLLVVDQHEDLHFKVGKGNFGFHLKRSHHQMNISIICVTIILRKLAVSIFLVTIETLHDQCIASSLHDGLKDNSWQSFVIQYHLFSAFLKKAFPSLPRRCSYTPNMFFLVRSF